MSHLKGRKSFSKRCSSLCFQLLRKLTHLHQRCGTFAFQIWFLTSSILSPQRRGTLMSLKSHYSRVSATEIIIILKKRFPLGNREEMREAKSLWSKIQMHTTSSEENLLKLKCLISSWRQTLLSDLRVTYVFKRYLALPAQRQRQVCFLSVNFHLNKRWRN